MMFFFTYGADDALQAHKGGWTVVEADTMPAAMAAYDMYYRRNSRGLRPFCDIYTEERFRKTDMYKNGNFGARCHDIITLSRRVYEN